MARIIPRIYILFLFLITGTPVFGQLPTQTQETGSYGASAAYIQGIEAFENEEYETAEQLLLEAYQNMDQPAGIAYALADTYLALDDLPNAALYGKQAVEADPEHKWYRLKLAEIYRSAGRNQATLTELQTLLDYHPNDMDGLFMLADTYKDYGEFVKSNQVVDRILKLTGNTPRILLIKFRNYEALGASDSALTQLEKIRELDPDNLEMLNMLGQHYARSGKYREAKEVLKDAMIRNNRDPKTLINLSSIYLEEQKWDSAGTLLVNFVADDLIQPEPKMEIARFFYAQVEESPQNIKLRVEAERIFDALTQNEPEYGPAFTLSGEYYRQAGKPEMALEKLAQANKLLPEDDIAWRQRLQLLLAQQHYKETIEVGKQANEHVPEDAYIQFFTGTAYMLDGQDQEAERWLKNAARAPARRPFKSVVYGTLGDVRANLEKHESSDEAYELALRYDAENDNAMNNYAYNLSVREENLERAKELALKAIEIAPENAAYLDTVGWVYYKLGDYDRARRYIRASIDTGEASAEVLEHLGDVYEKQDNLSEAKKWWQKALEKDSSRTHLESKIEG